MIRVCKSNIIFLCIHPCFHCSSICPSRYLLLNHWVEFNQTCYITSPHGQGMREQHYFFMCPSILMSVNLSVKLSPPKPLIMKTYLYNFDPQKPHFNIVKLGFTGVYIILLISAQNIDCGYSLEPPHRGSSNEYPQSMFWAEV